MYQGTIGWLQRTVASCAVAGGLAFGFAQGDAWNMVVCADPHAMPLSDRSEEGYENRIAEVLADHFGAVLSYDWYPYGPDMINLRLRGGHCDMVMGVPDGEEPFLTTIAYYVSPFVFVYRSDADFDVEGLDDPVLRELSIGLQDVGIPPHDALLQRGLAENITTNFGSERYAAVEDPLAQLVDAVIAGEIDVGVSWGPPAGYYAQDRDAELEVVPLPPIDTAPPFTNLTVPMAVGVRRGDDALRDRLEIALAETWGEINAILDEYGVPRQQIPAPVVDLQGPQ